MDKKSYTFDEIKLKMANYCTYQDRCHYEVEQKMWDFNLIPEAKDEIMLFLIRENFLNEERFTRSYIRGKFYQKQWGRTKIRINLLKKQVPEKLILQCFDEIDEQDYHLTAEKLFENYCSKVTGQNDYQKKSKTMRYLLNKGYEYETIYSVMNGE